MSAPPYAEVIEKVRARLLADETLAARIGNRLYPHVPQDTAYPYGVCRLEAATEEDDKSQDGALLSIAIDFFSRSQSELEVFDLYGAAHTALHRQSLTLTSPHQAIECRWENSIAPFLDEDGQTRHGVTFYQVLTTSPN